MFTPVENKKVTSLFQILLGPVDVSVDDGEPDRPAGGHHFLQRREHCLVDHLQRGLRHSLHGRLGSQLQDGHRQGRQHGNIAGPQVSGSLCVILYVRGWGSVHLQYGPEYQYRSSVGIN